MGKFIKRCLIVAVICIGVGIAASAAGITAGGLTELKDQILNGEWNFDFGSFGFVKVNPFYEIEDPHYFEDNEELFENEDRIEQVYAAESVTEIEVKGGGISIEVLPYDGSRPDMTDGGEVVVLASKSGRFQSFVREGELHIITTGKSSMDLGEGVVQIMIPREALDTRQMDVSIEATASAVYLEQLGADEVSLEISGGTVKWDVLLARELEMNVAAGVVEGTGTEVSESTDIDMKAGSVTFSGTFGKEVDIAVSAGKVAMQCDTAFNAYNYDLSCAGGSITVGGEKLDGVAKTREIDHNVTNSMNIECSAGAVEVQFS